MSAVKAIIVFLFIIFGILGLIFAYDGYGRNMDLSPKGMKQEHVITIIEKPDYEPRGNGYLVVVFTEENAIETYQISNSIMNEKWTPEDRKQRLEMNHTYYVKTYGVRNSVIVSYKNIIEIKELNDSNEIANETARIRAINEMNREELEAMLNNTSQRANKGNSART